MPSDEYERKGRSSATAPTEGPRSTAHPPSSSRTPAEFVAWGPARDAVTSIHNLETLLKSPRVAMKVLASVLPEFLASVSLLREAFGGMGANVPPPASGRSPDPKPRTPEATDARATLCAFTLGRLDALEAAMNHATTNELDARGRLALEQVVTRVSVDLDAAAELLDLAERAEHAAPNELSLDGLARSSVAALPRGEREVLVRVVRNGDDCLMLTDAHVLRRLLAFAVARTHAFGADHVTIRALCAPSHATIDVRASNPGDSGLASIPMRLVRRIDPTDAIVQAAARAAGIGIHVDGGAVTFTIPKAG